ncbi:MAG: glutamate--tRNA ligase [Deltaproteobacteria bacterium]|nr:glutamate--tRNA ligase [Deltaproteobacteria bacterium]
MEKPVRVRFAPSPTGSLHLGNARVALFNYLFARRQEGVFLLRVEDTDVERSTAEAESSILEDLRWLGLDWDEGPERPGDKGPYRQSERLEIYRRLAAGLCAADRAYRCYCTPEELEEKRRSQLARGTPPKYDGRCRNLKAEERKSLEEAGRPASLRFRVEARKVDFEDLIKGRMSFDGQMIGDFIILRSDGVAPYNFAAVTDDAMMSITHVIRGEDHLANTPRQLLLYQALGFSPPRFAHLPLILAPDRTPLSKRYGATSVRHFREEGYLPEALVNYLALLGWSPPDGREILRREELVRAFSLERISRSSAVFDPVKLKWVNRAHLKEVPAARRLEMAEPFLRSGGLDGAGKGEEWIRLALDVVWPEIETLSQLPERLQIFLRDELAPTPAAERLLRQPESVKVLRLMAEELGRAEELTPASYPQIMGGLTRRAGLSGRALLLPVRAALTGATRGPELEKIVLLLGKEKVMRRLEQVLQKQWPEERTE